MERIIDVYYGKDNLPYKDEARTIHFPVAGSEFLGASQTTTIRFHYEQIGTDENVYTVESKRPDGKTGSQLLSKNTTEHYAEMSLSGWYSECKGDLFLSLKVYRGGTTATYNEETQLWEVNGVPVIESTGAIKLAINYTPMGRYENYNDAISTYQDVLAALGDKLDTIKGIVGVSGLSQVDTTEYEEGQLFFDVDTKNIYKLESGEFIKINNKLEIVDVSGQTYQALLDKYGTQPFMSYFGETNNISVYQFKENTDGYELHCSSQKNGLIHIPSVVLANTFSTSDFTQLDFQSAPEVVISSTSGTLSNLDYEKLLQPNATIKYNNRIFTKTSESSNTLTFGGYVISSGSSTYAITTFIITITATTKTYRVNSTEKICYTNIQINQLLNAKQDKLVSGTNIKTINGESLLGSGNIVIQGGGSAEWGSIGGNIAEQTDLQNEFQEVREIATGRTRSAIISYLKEAPTEQTFSQIPYYDLRGNRIETWSDFVAFVNGRTFANSKFNSQNDDIEIDHDEYIIFAYNTRQTVYRGDEAYEVDTANDCLNEGDIIIVKETTDQQGETIPDRWVYISDQTLVCSKLETSKVNLDNYSTKSETSTEVNKIAHDIAVEYDENTLYGSGDLCIKDKLLYKCNTNNTTGTWDSTKWDLTTVNSELGVIKGGYASLTGNNTFSGQQNRFANGVESGSENDLTKYSNHAIVDRKFVGSSLINAIYNFPKSENGTFTIATTDQLSFPLLEAPTSTTLIDEQIAIISGGCRVNGTFLGLTNPVFLPTSTPSFNEIAGFVYEGRGLGVSLNIYVINTNNKTITLYTGSQAYRVSLGCISRLNGIDIKQFYKTPQSSVSLSDGGTITDNTLKTLIQKEQPIKLNGFTCYFSCDDGTNYQYVSTRYDSNANKNHINVITINKTTWVATFHTSDIAV